MAGELENWINNERRKIEMAEKNISLNRFIKRRAIGVNNWTSIMIYYKDHRNRSHFFNYGQN